MVATLLEPPVVLRLAADEDRIDRGPHVVVNAALAGTAEKAERPIMCVKHHLLALARVRSHIASIIETAKLNGVDPQAWLTNTLTRLAAGHSARRFGELMRWNHPAAVA